MESSFGSYSGPLFYTILRVLVGQRALEPLRFFPLFWNYVNILNQLLNQIAVQLVQYNKRFDVLGC